MENARAVLESFDTASMPDLDVAVLGALELFGETSLPSIPHTFRKPLVVGSVNAYATGTILFGDAQAVFADESSFASVLAQQGGIDGVVLISASGGKHAVGIAEAAMRAKKPVLLLTCNERAPAAASMESDARIVFPKNREPYTYNTSTYMGMILARTGEDPATIRTHLLENVAPVIPETLGSMDAFTFILPARFARLVPMVRTKFEELFGPRMVGRVFTEEEIKHAKTVVPSSTECFVSFGVEGRTFGAAGTHLAVPLPENAGYAAMMAITYYLVGHVQKQQPAYFKDAIVPYAAHASQVFGEVIEPIV